MSEKTKETVKTEKKKPEAPKVTFQGETYTIIKKVASTLAIQKGDHRIMVLAGKVKAINDEARELLGQ